MPHGKYRTILLDTSLLFEIVAPWSDSLFAVCGLMLGKKKQVEV